jgi:hypothetical protein
LDCRKLKETKKDGEYLSTDDDDDDDTKGPSFSALKQQHSRFGTIDGIQ